MLEQRRATIPGIVIGQLAGPSIAEIDGVFGTATHVVGETFRQHASSMRIARCGINSMSALGDLIFGGACNGMPNCRVALSETGAGWSPYVLERLDCTWERGRREGLENSVPPSEVFAERVWVCMMSDRDAIRNRDLIRVDKIMREADSPHNDSNWPDSGKVLADACADVPGEEVRRIREKNALERYRFPRP